VIVWKFLETTVYSYLKLVVFVFILKKEYFLNIYCKVFSRHLHLYLYHWSICIICYI